MSGNPFLHIFRHFVSPLPPPTPLRSNGKLFKESPQWVKESQRERETAGSGLARCRGWFS